MGRKVIIGIKWHHGNRLKILGVCLFSGLAAVCLVAATLSANSRKLFFLSLPGASSHIASTCKCVDWSVALVVVVLRVLLGEVWHHVEWSVTGLCRFHS